MGKIRPAREQALPSAAKNPDIGMHLCSANGGADNRPVLRFEESTASRWGRVHMKNVTINIRNKIMIAVFVPLIGMISFACLDVLDQRDTLTEDRKIHVRQMVEAAV